MKNSIKLRGTPDKSQQSALGTIQAWGDMDLGTKVYSAAQVETRIGDINTSVSQYIADHVSSAYIFKGSCAYAALPTTGQKVGDVYNVTDDFTLDSVKYTAGTDVAWIEEGTGEQKTGKWNALGGKTFDDSGVIKSVNEITPAEGSHAITIPTATSEAEGLMSSTQAGKLAGIAEGAQVNVIETVKVDDVALTPDANKAVNIDLSGKADKVANATSGNFAGLDQYGNLTNSGSKAADFATKEQGDKADSAIQSIKLNGSTITPSSDKEVDLGNLKTKQTAITTDPEATGEASAVVTSVKQNANGEITVVRANLPAAATVDQTYNPESTNAQSGTAVAQAVSGAVEALDAEVTSSGGTNVQVKVTQADGVVTAVNITSDTTASSTHTHGNISNDGKVGTASGKVLVTGDGGAVTAGELQGTYDATTNKIATQSTVTDAIAALDVTEVSVGASKTVDKISETDGKISVTTTDIQIAESQVIDLTTHLAAKANKVTVGAGAATAGNFFQISSTGDLEDSGKKATDFQPAGNYKTTQAEVKDTAVEGQYVSQVEQNANGEIKVTRAALPSQTTYTLDGSGTTVTLTPSSGSATSYTIPDVVASTSGSGGSSGVMTPAQAEKLAGIAAGAQINVLEAVKVNGTAQTITDKAVDLTLSDVVNSDSSTQFASSKAVKTANDTATTANNKVNAVNTAAASLLTALNDATTVSKAMNTANDIKAVVTALITALKTFAGAADNNA